MKLAFPAGLTGVILHVFIPDSAVTTGAGKTGLVFSGITAYYVRAGGVLTALTMETIATLGTWASTGDNYLGFKLLNDTNAPGLYELHLSNNILVTGANQIVIQLRATGAAPTMLEIQFKGLDVSQISNDSTAADRLEAILDASRTGTVNDAGATTTDFDTTITGVGNDFLNDAFLVFTGGSLLGQSRRITDYVSATGNVSFTNAFTAAPANSDPFIILGRSE